ncbi:MAG: DUF6116 family protein [Pseudomonadota bacterium]
MKASRVAVSGALLKYAAGLRFKQLFFLSGALFLLDVLIPDLIPFADELLLGLLTLLFGAWRKGRTTEEAAEETAKLPDDTPDN